MERTIGRNEKEYTKLEIVAKLLEFASPNNAKYVVEDVYFDYGQDWMWTTICRRGYRDCQVLSPREWKEIMMADEMWEFGEIARKIREDKYFGDK